LDAGQEALRRQKADDLLEPVLSRLDFGPAACRMAGEALLQRRPLVRRESVLGGPLDSADDCRLVIFVPLLAEQKPVGVLRIRRAAEDLADGEAELLEELLIESAKHIALALKKEDDDRLAITDGLTKLLVKRRFLHMLEERRALAESGQGRRNDAFVLAMIDIDHFKKINDTHGHLSGDIVLRDVAGILRGGLRDGDYAFRYGGEEMALLLNTPSLETGRKTAERLRKAIQTATFRGDKGQAIPVTASMGLSLFEPGLSAEGLIARADKALYASKHGGRNRVTVWEPALEKQATPTPATTKPRVNSVRAPAAKRSSTSLGTRTSPAKSSRQN
jgi:diguanylate cyclase (GGDEF)-like protein